MANQVIKKTVQYTGEFDITKILNSIKSIKDSLSNTGVNANFTKQFDNLFKNIEQKASQISSRINAGFSSTSSAKALEKDFGTFNRYMDELVNKMATVDISLKDINLPEDFLSQIKEAEKELTNLITQSKNLKGVTFRREELRNSLKTQNLPQNAVSTPNMKSLAAAVDDEAAFKQVLTDNKIELQTLLQNNQTAISSLEAQKAAAAQLIAAINKIQDSNSTRRNRKISNLVEGSSIKDEVAGYTSKEDLLNRIGKVTSEADAKERQYAKTVSETQRALQANNEVNKTLLNTRQELVTASGELDAKLNQSGTAYKNLVAQGINPIKNAVEGVTQETRVMGETLKQSGEKAIPELNKTTSSIENQTRAFQSLSATVAMYVGLDALFRAAGRAIRAAWEDLKGFDKAFTAIAVVTDKTTKELWNSFGQYNKLASQLGATTQSAIETSALYYQQGLEAAEVWDLTEETIKMASIAGMDFAEATDRMTSALRGFKLEAKDAAMINDIFSALAAKAAVDTEELSYALTKTASIAKSAGMAIQTTSAFLTQMIETTREAPENLGTAMKTIIARFQELKKNPAQLSVEVDGEAVVANKIESALKLAGVELRDKTTQQFRDLDKVFLELAAKWQDLDRNTQRYIATMAAGSRQQSRFLAMMDDYDRLMELIDIAQNSQNASSIQFAKTLDGIEAKLNRLKAAWENLYTKFVNSEMFKGVILALTNLANKLSDFPPQVSALMVIVGAIVVKSVATTMINTADVIATGMSKISTQLTGSATLLGKGLAQGITGGLLAALLGGDLKTILITALIPIFNVALNEILSGTFAALEDMFKARKALKAEKLAEAAAAAAIEKKSAEEAAAIRVAGATAAATVETDAAKASAAIETGGEVVEGAIEGATEGGIVAGAAAGKGLIAGISPFLAKVGGLLAKALPYVAIAAAVAAIGYGLYKWLDPLTQAQNKAKELHKALEKAGQDLDTAKNKYFDTKNNLKTIQDYIKQYDKLKNKMDMTVEDQEELNTLVTTISEKYPELVDYYDASGQAVLKQQYAWEEILKLQKESFAISQKDYMQKQLIAGILNKETVEADTKVSQINADRLTATIDRLAEAKKILNETVKADQDVTTQLARKDETITATQPSQTFSPIQGAPTTPTDKTNVGTINFDEVNNLKEQLSEEQQNLQQYRISLMKASMELESYVKSISANSLSDYQQTNNLQSNSLLNAGAQKAITEALKQQSPVIEQNLRDQGLKGEELAKQLTSQLSDLSIQLGQTYAEQINMVSKDPKVQTSFDNLSKSMQYMSKESFDQAIVNIGAGLSSEIKDGLNKLYEESTRARDELLRKILGNPARDFKQFKDIAINGSSENTMVGLLKNQFGLTDEQILEAYSAYQTGLQSFRDYIMNHSNMGEEDAMNFATSVFNSADETTNLEEIGRQYGMNFVQYVVDGYKDATDEHKEEIANAVESLHQVIADNSIDQTTFASLAESADFTSFEGLQSLAEQLVQNGMSAENAAKAVLDFSNAVQGISMNPSIDMLNDSFAESIKSIQTLVTNYKGLNAAMQEQKKNGSIALTTALDLIEAGKAEALVIDEKTGSIKVSNEAAKLEYKNAVAIAKAKAELAAAQTNAIILGIDNEIKINQDKEKQLLSVTKEGAIAKYKMLQLQAEAEVQETIAVTGQQVTITGQGLQNILTSYNSFTEQEKAWYQTRLKNAAAFGRAQIQAMTTGVEASMGLSSSSVSMSVQSMQSIQDNLKASLPSMYDPGFATKVGEVYDTTLKAYQDNTKALEALKQRYVDLEGKQLDQLAIYDKLAALDLDSLYNAENPAKAGKAVEDYVSKLKELYNILALISALEDKIDLLGEKRELLSDAGDITRNLMDSEKAMRDAIAAYEAIIPFYKQQQDLMYKQLVETSKGYVQMINGILQINRAAIMGLSDKAQEKIDDLLSKYDEITDSINNAEKSILSYRKSIQDMISEYRNSFIEVENKIVEILKKRDQDEVDSVKEKYDALKELDNDYLDALRKNIEKRRKLRDETDDRKELDSMEKRLALLKRDTSGAYATQIAELEKEIAQQRQDIADNQTDMMLDNLEENAQNAADTYDEEVKTLQDALDAKLESMTEYWKEVDRIMDGGYDSMLNFLKKYDTEFLTASKTQQEAYLETWKKTLAEAQGYADGITEGLGKQTGSVTIPSDTGTGTGGTSGSKGGGSGSGGGGTGTGGSTSSMSSTKVANLQKFLKLNGLYNWDVSGIYDSKTKAAVSSLQRMLKVTVDGIYGKKTQQALYANKGIWKGTIPAYEKGGLVDVTGPVWVDGTKTKPESFLSAEDTELFSQLRDILIERFNSKTTKSVPDGSKNQTPLTLQIDVHVDKLANDYDVDDMVDRVEQKIVDAASYRGLTIIKSQGKN